MEDSTARIALLALLLISLPSAFGATCAPGHPTPVIAITSHADGTFSLGSSLTIEGWARRGGTPIVSVTVNDVSVLPLTGDPQNGTWSYELGLDPVAIINPVVAEMVLASGATFRRRITVIAGDSIADGSMSPESIALRLNDTGLDQVEPVITSLVNLDPATLVPPDTVVIHEYCYFDTIFGCVGSARATVDGNPAPSISGFAIDIDAETGQVDGDITLDDLFVRAKVEDVVGIPFTCFVDIGSAVTSIDGDYLLDPDALDPSLIDVTQSGGVSVSFTNFSDDTNCNGLLGGLVELFVGLFVGSFQDLMQTALEDFLDTADANNNTPIAGAIEVALGDVQIAGPIGEAIGVVLDTTLFEVSEDVDGITLGNDGSFVADPVLAGSCHDELTSLEMVPVDPCAFDDPCPVGQFCGAGPSQCVAHPESPDFPASFHVDETFPTLGATTPLGLNPYDMGLCVSTSSFNQLLKAQLECGLLTQDVTEISLFPSLPPVAITGEALVFFFPEIAMFPLSTAYKLELRPTISTIVTGDPGPGGELARLILGGLTVHLRDVNEEFPLLITLAVDTEIGLDVTFVGGEIQFSLSGPLAGATSVDVLRNFIGTDEPTLEFVVANLFAAAIPDLASALEGFPLPDFLGLQLGLVEIDRAGEFLSLFLDLSPAS
jgi:hypothetical protein